MKGITARLLNYEGVLVKTLALPYFMHEVQLARMRRLSLMVGSPEEAPLPVERRTFRFHDREGNFHIYKEV